MVDKKGKYRKQKIIWEAFQIVHRLLSSHPYYFNIQGFIHSSIFLGQLLNSWSVTALSSNISFYLWIYLSNSRAIYRSILSIYHLRVYTWSHCLTLLNDSWTLTAWTTSTSIYLSTYLSIYLFIFSIYSIIFSIYLLSIYLELEPLFDIIERLLVGASMEYLSNYLPIYYLSILSIYYLSMYLEPLFNVVEWLLVGDVVDDDDTVGAPIVARCDRPEINSSQINCLAFTGHNWPKLVRCIHYM